MKEDDFLLNQFYIWHITHTFLLNSVNLANNTRKFNIPFCAPMLSVKIFILFSAGIVGHNVPSISKYFVKFHFPTINGIYFVYAFYTIHTFDLVLSSNEIEYHLHELYCVIFFLY